MMISSKGRYALRVMLDMAEQSGGGNIRLKDIAARQNISVKYLESIMTALCKSGLVESALGKDGGYRLRRAPEAYTAGEILRAAEGELFAETYAFLPDQPMLVSVVAAERGEALFLDPGKLMAPGCEPWRWQMMQNLLHILAGKNLNLARRSLYTAPKTIRERVTAYFSTLAVQKGSLEFELPFDRQQLADHLGVDRSALSSTLSAMQRDGLLTIDRRRVCLKKAEGL